jgi:hypothetical protein
MEFRTPVHIKQQSAAGRHIVALYALASLPLYPLLVVVTAFDASARALVFFYNAYKWTRAFFF